MYVRSDENCGSLTALTLAFYVMVEVAENFKNQGNECFKQGKKFYKDALLFYTNGLEVFCKDDKLNETLYVNRAACNLHFGKDILASSYIFFCFNTLQLEREKSFRFRKCIRF